MVSKIRLPRVPLGSGLDDGPGRELRVGQLQHLLGGRQVVRVFLVAGPIGVADPPGLQRIGLDGAKTRLLLLLRDVQEELEDHCAVIGQHALELDDVAVRVAPRLLGNRALHPVVQNADVPTAVEDHHLAAVRRLQPEAPQPGTLLLVGARSGDGIELEPARIQALRKGRDRRALSGGVPAFEDDDGRYALVPAGLFEIVQAVLDRRQKPLVRLLRKPLLEIDVFQHGFSVNSSRLRRVVLGLRDRPLWRRKRDSNPRVSHPTNGFQDRRLQPLGHSSDLYYIRAVLTAVRPREADGPACRSAPSALS